MAAGARGASAPVSSGVDPAYVPDGANGDDGSTSSGDVETISSTTVASPPAD